MFTPLLLLFCSLLLGTAVFLLALYLGGLSASIPASETDQSLVSERRSARRINLADESPAIQLAMRVIRSLARLFRGPRFASLRDYFAKPYAKAGYPGGFEEAELLAISAVFGTLLTLLIGLIGYMVMPPAGALMGVIGMPISTLYIVSSLRTRSEFRRRQVEVMLPYAVDLLVLVIRAGTSVGIALERVVYNYQNHPIGEEFGQVLAEIQMGLDRNESFQRLAQRLDLEDISLLVENITQSEELGWPLAETLASYSDRLVKQRVIKAEEYAGTASVMVMLPSTLVLAAVILTLFSPLIVRAMRGELSF